MLCTTALAFFQEAPKPAEHDPLNTLGAIFMILSVGFVTILTFWCFYRVLTAPEPPPHELEALHTA